MGSSDDDDDNSWSIHDLDHVPPPKATKTAASIIGSSSSKHHHHHRPGGATSTVGKLAASSIARGQELAVAFQRSSPPQQQQQHQQQHRQGRRRSLTWSLGDNNLQGPPRVVRSAGGGGLTLPGVHLLLEPPLGSSLHHHQQQHVQSSSFPPERQQQNRRGSDHGSSASSGRTKLSQSDARQRFDFHARNHHGIFSRRAAETMPDTNVDPMPPLRDYPESQASETGAKSKAEYYQQFQKRRSRSGSQESRNSVVVLSSDASDLNTEDDDILYDEDPLYEEGGEDDTDSNTLDSSISSTGPAILCGVRLPGWCKKLPSGYRVASFVATNAPCFWCAGGSRQLTDRASLGRLNVLCVFFSLGQIASLLWLAIVMSSPYIVNRNLADDNHHRSSQDEAAGTAPAAASRYASPFRIVANIIAINSYVYALGFLAFIILVTAILTIRVVINVNLVGAIRFLWTLLWIIPLEIFFVIALFDYFRVTNVWIKHWWRDSSMAWFRRKFCTPPSAANTLCSVPISQNETAWCLEHYNSTQCTQIRDAAQLGTERFMISYYYLNAGWGVILIILLLLAVDTLENIISKPLVSRSRQGNFARSLALPIVGCLVLGSVFAFANSSVLNTGSQLGPVSWFGPLYIVTGGLFILGALLVWNISAASILKTGDKRKKLCAIVAFIVTMSLALVMLATIFAASIAFSVSLVDFPISHQLRGDIACAIDQVNGCTRCDEITDRCPEWTSLDATKVLQTQAKSSAALAAIFLLYAVGGIKIGFALRKHVTMYQISYV